MASSKEQINETPNARKRKNIILPHSKSGSLSPSLIVVRIDKYVIKLRPSSEREKYH
jgi:hypothetical protein